MTNDLARVIDAAWDARETLGPATKGEVARRGRDRAGRPG